MTFPYEDIVRLPHPVSVRRAPMTDADRAAQFSPFAALNGHGDAIRETARLTDSRIELDENEKDLLNEKLRLLLDRLPERPSVTLTCFVRDPQKPGGAYVTVTDRIKRIDGSTQTLYLESGQPLKLEDLYGVTDGQRERCSVLF